MESCPSPLVADNNFDCGELLAYSIKLKLPGYIHIHHIHIHYNDIPLNLSLDIVQIHALTLVGCGSLDLANGQVSYSQSFALGSVANHTCNVGYSLSPVGGELRTCNMTGWTGNNVTCGTWN